MSTFWNPWHGCKRVSEGCRNCYVYRIDGRHGKDGGEIRLNSDYLLPLKKVGDRDKIESGETVYTCFSSDFLLEDADEWRVDAWKMMRMRSDLHFVFFTKRIERLESVLPPDWGDGYENVTVGCTVENQDRADFRLPIFLKLPIFHRFIICEPLLSAIDLRPYLDRRLIEYVCAGGESGDGARVCDFSWIEEIRDACRNAKIPFEYHQTGALLQKEGKLYRIPRRLQHTQARLAQEQWKKDDQI